MELRLPVAGKLKEGVGKNYAWPGNVRELEQAIRRIMITGAYEGDTTSEAKDEVALGHAVEAGNLTAKELVARY